MPDHYYTIEEVSEGIFKDRGSKFLSFAYPVRNEQDIKSVLEELRKKFHDARHHCYAWILGAEGNTWRANDDGEPSNTAGKPILTQIQSFGLTYTLVVVVRYFGGVLLGTGGLINAYRVSSKDALEKARIKKEYLKSTYQITFSYDEINAVMKVLKDVNADFLQQEFSNICRLQIAIRKSLNISFNQNFESLPGVKIILQSED